MNPWDKVAEARGAMHAANEALWVIIELDQAAKRVNDTRHEVELERLQKECSRVKLDYITAREAALLSGEPHPCDKHKP